jgi:hypothetical protein
MKLEIICFIFIWIKCYTMKHQDDYIVKFSNDFYKQLKSDQIEKYKESIIQNMNGNFTKMKSRRLQHEFNDMSLYYDDFIVKERVVKFYISQLDECNMLINDTILYEQNEHANIVEHMILHNNADYIDPKGVFSNNVELNYFVFNKKINLYSIFFNNPKKLNQYHIEYDYNAVGVIKEVKDLNTGQFNNTFIWKLYNENNNLNQHVRIEMYFNLDKGFEKEDVFFLQNFTKSITYIENSEVVLYTWEGEMKPQEVMVIQAAFPLYIESCGFDYVTVPMVLLGSIFIVFLVVILYLIISSLICDDV